MKTVVMNDTAKKQWEKPVVNKMDIATVTKSGPFAFQTEDPHNNFYGPQAS